MLRFVTYCGLAPVLAHTKNESKVSSTVGVNASHAYYSRWILQKNKNIIGQPYTNSTFNNVGAASKIPLNVPETYCNWEGSGGVNLLELGKYLRDINDSGQYQPVGFFSFSIGC